MLNRDAESEVYIRVRDQLSDDFYLCYHPQASSSSRTCYSRLIERGTVLDMRPTVPTRTSSAE
jgi:hypothetical protein